MRFLLALLLVVMATAAPAYSQAPESASKERFTLSAMLDSAALSEALLAVPNRPTTGSSWYSVAFDSTGALNDVTIMSEPDTPFDSAVVALLRERITPRVGTREAAFMYLSGTWGAQPVLATYVPTRIRRPMLSNRGVVTAQVQDIGKRFAVLLPGGGVQTVVRLRVDARGTPDSVVMQRGSGNAELDRAIVAGMRRSRFRPAMIGEHAVRVWVELPINIIAPAQGFAPPR